LPSSLALLLNPADNHPDAIPDSAATPRGCRNALAVHVHVSGASAICHDCVFVGATLGLRLAVCAFELRAPTRQPRAFLDGEHLPWGFVVWSKAARHIWHNEGVTGYFKGNGANVSEGTPIGVSLPFASAGVAVASTHAFVRSRLVSVPLVSSQVATCGVFHRWRVSFRTPRLSFRSTTPSRSSCVCFSVVSAVLRFKLAAVVRFLQAAPFLHSRRTSRFLPRTWTGTAGGPNSQGLVLRAANSQWWPGRCHQRRRLLAFRGTMLRKARARVYSRAAVDDSHNAVFADCVSSYCGPACAIGKGNTTSFLTNVCCCDDGTPGVAHAVVDPAGSRWAIQGHHRLYQTVRAAFCRVPMVLRCCEVLHAAQCLACEWLWGRVSLFAT
jgi:hypothetical protein